MKRLVLLSCIGLSGCATTSENMELAWQAMHVVDTAQTLAIIHSPCLRELDPIVPTDSDRSTVSAMAAFGVLHWMATRWIEEHGTAKQLEAWHVISLGLTAGVVLNNQYLLSKGC